MDPKKVLEKFGWSEGEGLGKTNTGISEPLKVFMKRDTGGVGYSPSDEFTNDWWQKAFNEASKNITVEQTDNEVVVRKRKRKKSDSSKSSRFKAELKYNGFVKSTAVVVDGETVNEHLKKKQDDCNTTPKVFLKSISDEELLTACGGRTAHKAARHGFKLSGKMERLMRQEAELQSSRHDNHQIKTRTKHKPLKL